VISAIRTALVGIVIVVYAILVGLPALLIARITGSPTVLYRAGHGGAWIGLKLAGVRYRVVGRQNVDPEQNYVFMPNHQSNLDPSVVMLGIDRDLRFMAKASLFRIPVLGQAMLGGGFVPVERDKREKAVAAVEAAAGELRRGHDFLIFPEGTRSRDGRMLPLKKGPFILAIKAQVPIVPVAVRGTCALWPKGSMKIRAGDVTLVILDPIPTEGLETDSRHALRDKVQARLRERVHAPPGSA
jgi:1-acyl-sn-glycerol-3-phosphate acyltransferase